MAVEEKTHYQKNAATLKEKLDQETKWFQDHVIEPGIDPVDLPAEKKEEYKKLKKEIEELTARVEESKEYNARAGYAAIATALVQPIHRPDYGDNDNKGDEKKNKSLGYEFANSKEYQEWFKAIAPSGEMNEGMAINNSFPAFDAKALITGGSTSSAGAMVRRDYAGLVDFPFRPLALRDVVTVGRTGSDLIEFPRVVSYTSAAEPVAEATTVPTSFAQAGNGLKPESSMVLEKVTAAVKTIAHWIPVTNRALSDAAQIETLINNFLDTGLEIALETEMIQGNGTGEHFLGLDNTPNITLQAFDTDMLVTTRKALTKVQVVGRARATAFVLNPYDWESIDLTQDAEDRFYFGGPMVLGQKRLWGQPVVESEAVFQGTFYTGDMKQAILWDRERATIRMSDAPYDMFLRNMKAILAELRAAFGVFRPPAIVRGDLHAGSNS